MHQVDLLIIGAGAIGLACAARLASPTRSCLIIEAQALIVAAPQQADLTLQPAFFPSIHDGTVVVPPVVPATDDTLFVGVQPGWMRDKPEPTDNRDALERLRRQDRDMLDIAVALITILENEDSNG